MEIHLAQILFQMVNFGVVFGALTYLMYKPVLKALRQRSQKIADSQQAADELLQEKAEIEKQKTKVVSQARKEANDLMAEARQQADTKKADLLKKAKQEVQAYVEDGKSKWAVEKQQKLAELEKQMADAVFAVAEKVVGQTLDKKTHATLIDQGIKEVLVGLK